MILKFFFEISSSSLDAYYSKSSGYNSYDYLSSRHNSRLYDSRLSNPNYGYDGKVETFFLFLESSNLMVVEFGQASLPPPHTYGTSSMPLLNETVPRSRKIGPEDFATAAAAPPLNGTGEFYLTLEFFFLNFNFL